MQISIHPPGEVVVVAPLKYSVESIEGFLDRKAQWVLHKLRDAQKRHAVDLAHKNSQECFYLGKQYPVKLNITQNPWGKINFNDDGWVVEIPSEKSLLENNQYVVDFMLKWFKSRAKHILEDRVSVYAKIMGVLPTMIQIRSPKGLWGSCHPVKRVLHFNWKIIMAPVEVMDYIVIHELCHIKVPNHSKSFWSLVGLFCPDFKAHHRWLKTNGHWLKLPSGFPHEN